jgi:DNA modification methylase
VCRKCGACRIDDQLGLESTPEEYVAHMEAIKEPMAEASAARYEYSFGGEKNIRLKATDKPTALVGNRDVTDGRNRRSVWTITTKPYKEAHFATFPPEIPKLCILAATRPGDVVLDPFLGSGTTAAVALEFGRRYIGIELKAEYVELARMRLKQTNVGLGI